METVTMDSEYQIDIPRELCEQLKLSPGSEMQIIDHGNRIELIPIRFKQIDGSPANSVNCQEELY